MADYVIVEQESGPINAARDMPRICASRGYIDAELEQRWIRMIGFRDILVYDYLEVDRRIVYGVVRDSLGDLKKLGQVFTRFL